MSKSVKVVQDPQTPVEREVLATAILRIAASFGKLSLSGINRRGVIALIADDTKLPKGTIISVLDSIDALAKNYTR